jgi:hypothetical protein
MAGRWPPRTRLAAPSWCSLCLRTYVVASMLISSSFRALWLKQRSCRPIRQQIRLRYCHGDVDSCVAAKRHWLQAGLQSPAVLLSPSDAPGVSNGARKSRSGVTGKSRESVPSPDGDGLEPRFGRRDVVRDVPFGAPRRSIGGGRADCPILRPRTGAQCASPGTRKRVQSVSQLSRSGPTPETPMRPPAPLTTPWPMPWHVTHGATARHPGTTRRRARGPLHAPATRRATFDTAGGRFMPASPFATLVSGYVPHIQGARRSSDDSGKTTRNAWAPTRGAPAGVGRTVQRLPEAQGQGAPQPEDGTAGVRYLRRPRAHARRSVHRLRRAQAAAGPQPLLRLLQAPVAHSARLRRAGAARAPGPPPRPSVLSGQRQRHSRIV